MDDQENIKRIHEWDRIRKEMEAGATNINPRRAVPLKNNYLEDKASMAQIVNELKKELQSQGDTVAEYEKQDWDDPAEYIAQGWCEALEFAIKLIQRHNGSCDG